MEAHISAVTHPGQEDVLTQAESKISLAHFNHPIHGGASWREPLTPLLKPKWLSGRCQSPRRSSSLVLSALCHQSGAFQRLTAQTKPGLIYTPHSRGCLRFLCRPPGNCCLSSKCGPGSIFSTSSMLRQPGLAHSCVSRMLRGA